jgi:hypothetical protein
VVHSSSRSAARLPRGSRHAGVELSGAPVLEAPIERDIELRPVDVSRYAGLSAVPDPGLALLPPETA